MIYLSSLTQRKSFAISLISSLAWAYVKLQNFKILVPTLPPQASILKRSIFNNMVFLATPAYQLRAPQMRRLLNQYPAPIFHTEGGFFPSGGQNLWKDNRPVMIASTMMPSTTVYPYRQYSQFSPGLTPLENIFLWLKKCLLMQPTTKKFGLLSSMVTV